MSSPSSSCVNHCDLIKDLRWAVTLAMFDAGPSVNGDTAINIAQKLSQCDEKELVRNWLEPFSTYSWMVGWRMCSSYSATNPAGGMQGVKYTIFSNPSEGCLCLAFQATIDINTAKQSLSGSTQCLSSSISKIPRSSTDWTVPQVHSLIQKNYLTLRKNLVDGIANILQLWRSEQDGYSSSVSFHTVYVVGYSLGGSLATLGALDVATSFAKPTSHENLFSSAIGFSSFFSDRVRLKAISIGASPVGDKNFKHFYQQLCCPFDRQPKSVHNTGPEKDASLPTWQSSRLFSESIMGSPKSSLRAKSFAGSSVRSNGDPASVSGITAVLQIREQWQPRSPSRTASSETWKCSLEPETIRLTNNGDPIPTIFAPGTLFDILPITYKHVVKPSYLNFHFSNADENFSRVMDPNQSLLMSRKLSNPAIVLRNLNSLASKFHAAPVYVKTLERVVSKAHLLESLVKHIRRIDALRQEAFENYEGEVEDVFTLLSCSADEIDSESDEMDENIEEDRVAKIKKTVEWMDTPSRKKDFWLRLKNLFRYQSLKKTSQVVPAINS